MFLLVLDKDPVKSAKLIPTKIRFKQLLELCQLVCSSGMSNIYKPIKQGKDLQKWVKNNPKWTYYFLDTLLNYCEKYNKANIDTIIKFHDIAFELLGYCNEDMVYNPTTAIFRYSKDYQSDIPTNTELPIDECIEQYKKYVEWEKLKGIRGYV